MAQGTLVLIVPAVAATRSEINKMMNCH